MSANQPYVPRKSKVTDNGLIAHDWDTWLVALAQKVNRLNNQVLTGTGTPENVVTAAVGTLFLRTDSANVLYVKQTGTGSTGWVLK